MWPGTNPSTGVSAVVAPVRKGRTDPGPPHAASPSLRQEAPPWTNPVAGKDARNRVMG